MGNCLVMEKKMIKIMRNDGKVIEYKGPIKVHHILTQFSDHYSLSYNDINLNPQAKLVSGRLYYLIPDTVKHKKMTKKVKFSIPEVEEEEERLRDCGQDMETKKCVGVVRVKMVVSKQELEKILHGGSVHEMVYRSLAKQNQRNDDDGNDNDNDDNDDDDDDEEEEEVESQRGWKPLLASIPEYD